MAPKKKRTSSDDGRPRMARFPMRPADETCTVSRVVDREGLRLVVWTCSDPVRFPCVPWWKAYRFPKEYAQRWWPGCQGAWYDAYYYWNDMAGSESCVPGRTQFVLYGGGRRA